MKIENLINLDNSLVEVFTNNSNVDILNITDTYELKPNSLVFIKAKNFLAEVIAKKATVSNIGFVIEKKYFDSMSESELAEIKPLSLFLLTATDVNVSMSKLSHSFYLKKYPNPNDWVDGRQMGTASIHPTSYIAQNVFIGENVKIKADVKIHPGCVVMSGVTIEENSEIYPNVTIYRNVKIGKNVRIHSGSVIGADGFGYNFFQGEHLKVWHMGSVEIHDNVEIGANSCVDSGTFSPTIIGEGSKIDNLVQVGHNCRLGKKVILCGHVALAGSATLRDYVAVGGKAAVGNGVTIGMGAQIAGLAGVLKDVGDKEVVGGFPARDFKEWMRGNAVLRNLANKKSKE
jgi:UDP-3-O-[3-hydroxymyristoyl] glucosamine N-acyltransferase